MLKLVKTSENTLKVVYVIQIKHSKYFIIDCFSFKSRNRVNKALKVETVGNCKFKRSDMIYKHIISVLADRIEAHARNILCNRSQAYSTYKDLKKKKKVV